LREEEEAIRQQPQSPRARQRRLQQLQLAMVRFSDKVCEVMAVAKAAQAEVVAATAASRSAAGVAQPPLQPSLLASVYLRPSSATNADDGDAS
jgi:hypothetical protein